MRASEDLDLLLALGTPLLLSLVAAYLLSLRLRVLLQALAVLLSPVGFYVLGEGLRELGALGADPDQAFSQSWDNLELFAVVLAAFIGWEAGLVGGAISAAVRRGSR
jgi:Na+/proline symporter